ncbi:MAG: hypothetical protein IPN32_04435 [Deltaproteobacteria bacterium]|nr:hypothetical protein [Deltaproteobacteria bacterium]
MDDELLRALARTQRRGNAPDTSMPDAQPLPIPAPELIAPFDSAERDALLDAVFAEVDGDTAAAQVTPITAAPKATRGRAVGLVAVALAIAAVLVLWLARPGGSVAPLPSYELTELRGGAATVRAEPGDVDRELALAPGDRIEVTLTPAAPSTAAMVVDLVAQSPGRADVTARVPAQVSPSGAVRVSGPLDALVALEPGAWQIWVVLSPADAAPGDAREVLAQPNVRKVGFRVKLAAPG